MKLGLADLMVYLSCFIAISLSLYTISTVNDTVATCNEHWRNNFEAMCVVEQDYIIPSEEFNLDTLNFSINIT